MPFLPVHAVLAFFIHCFAYSERAISRQREQEADIAGASVASPAALATALVKFAAMASIVAVLNQEMFMLMKQGRAHVNISDRYRSLTEARLAGCDRAGMEAILGTSVEHPTDTHPPTSVQLGICRLTVDEVISNLSLRTQAAISLVRGAEKIERGLTVVQAAVFWDLLAKHAAHGS